MALALDSFNPSSSLFSTAAAVRRYAPRTPSVLSAPRGGGQVLPPFLQTRVGGPTPVISPRPLVDGDRVAAGPKVSPGEALLRERFGRSFGTPDAALERGLQSNLRAGFRPPPFIQRPVVAGGAPGGLLPPTKPSTPRPGGIAGVPTLGGNAPATQQIFEFLKSNLERERKGAESRAIANAAERGVFYGTPLTTSLGDIGTEFQRGLGELAAQTLAGEQSRELQRLQLAASLLPSAETPELGEVSPDFFASLGKAFAPRQPAAAGQPGAAGGQVITLGGRQFTLGPDGRLVPVEEQ